MAREQLRTKEFGRACIHLNYQLKQTNIRIQALKSVNQDVAYMMLSIECSYWRNLYKDIEVNKAEFVRIIQDL